MPNFLNDEETDLLAAEFVLGTLDPEERERAHGLLEGDHAFIGMVRVWERRFGELHLMVEPLEPDPTIWDRIKAKVTESATRAAEAAPVPATAGELPVSREPTEAQMSPDLTATTAAAPAADEIAPGPDSAPTVDLIGPPEKPRPPQTVVRGDTGPNAPTLVPEASLQPPKQDAGLVRSLRRWRAFAMLMTLVLAGLGGLLAAWKYVPGRVPPALQPPELLAAIGISVVPPIPKVPPVKKPAPPEAQFDE